MTTQNGRVRRVGVAFMVLAVVLAACDTQSTTTTVPAGPAGDVARQVAAVVASNADIVDQPFEDFQRQGLHQLIGRGRFRFIGLPLRIRGGTGSPVRAVAVFEG